MTRETYRRMTESLRAHKRLTAALPAVNRALTVFVAAVYLLTLLSLFARMTAAAHVTVLIDTAVPGAAFVILSAVRKKLNRPRPYEVFGLPPVLPPHKEGCSFPSRHVFSAFVIGTALLGVWVPAGIACLAAGVLLAGIRVGTGVHFPEDVAAGAAIGAAAGIVALILAEVIL